MRGRAAMPTWLEIDEHDVRFLDARHLWGLDVEEVQHELPPKVGHVVIGPAGENLVRFAAILSGERVLGRGGVGAVMGSKNLKVVTVSGARRMRFHDPKGFGEALKKWVRALQKHSITGGQLPRYGTAAMVTGTNATRTLPTHNFQRGQWEHAHEIGGDVMAERDLVMNDGCTSCPIRCGRVVADVAGYAAGLLNRARGASTPGRTISETAAGCLSCHAQGKQAPNEPEAVSRMSCTTCHEEAHHQEQKK